ncbi:uncharacterized protein LOC141904318 [Tubulanus polymorphus]|uniref:uncharacterized protein LOC141904318 n=1 Tax=Tubulanus polymorphus TaxID=672921 RepID=UPI003DA23867
MVCEKCGKSHPTVLHFRDRINSSVTGPSETGLTGHTGVQSSCSLAIIPVRLSTKNGTKSVTTYAFFDPGSTITFLSDQIREQLNCSGKKSTLSVQTIDSVNVIESYALNNISVHNYWTGESVLIPRAYSKADIPVSSRYVPNLEDVRKWPHLHDVSVAELPCKQIGILIGNNIAEAYTPVEMRTGPPGSPHACKTALGWVVWNLCPKEASSFFTASTAITEVHDQNLENLVRGAMALDFPDHFGTEKQELSQLDKRFLKQVDKSINLRDGHYTIKLPVVSENVCLPDNRCYAERRLNSLRRKLVSDAKLYDSYKLVIDTMLELGHAEPVPLYDVAVSGKTWYLPHHAVLHAAKPGKVRVVFDGSSEFFGVSLNDCLLQGPDFTNSLLGVLLRFRENAIAIKADITKMFYQIHVPPEDRNLLRFLWWKDGDMKTDPLIYRLTVHPFGAKSSPSCANYALHQTAYDNTDLAESVRQCVLRNFYVDDFIKSVKTESEALDLVAGVSNLCNCG